MRIIHLNKEGFVVGWDGFVKDSFKTIETDFLVLKDFVAPRYDFVNSKFIEGASQSDFEIHNNKIALFEEFPNLKEVDYKLLSLDNLEGIKRISVFSIDGICREKQYFKNDVKIWSIHTEYWDDVNSIFLEGILKTVKIYNLDNTVFDSWGKFIVLNDNQKLQILENRLLSV
jgi:hypothetical protein